MKGFHIFPHTVASNVVFRQKYVLSEKGCLCPVIKIVHKYLMPQNFGNILFHLPTIQKTLVSETHRFSPQMRLIIKQPVTENRLRRKEMWCVADNYIYMCRICAKRIFRFDF